MTNEFDPFDPSRLQARARMLLARAARMQDLHGQTQANALSHLGAPAADAATAPVVTGPQGQPSPGRLISQAAGQAVADTHHALQVAAAQARRLALTDPVISRLDAEINGIGSLLKTIDSDVVDVPAIEMVVNATPDPSVAEAGNGQPPAASPNDVAPKPEQT